MECGHEKTCIVPIVKGKMINDIAIVTDIAGLAIQTFLKRLLHNNSKEFEPTDLEGNVTYI